MFYSLFSRQRAAAVVKSRVVTDSALAFFARYAAVGLLTAAELTAFELLPFELLPFELLTVEVAAFETLPFEVPDVLRLFFSFCAYILIPLHTTEQKAAARSSATAKSPVNAPERIESAVDAISSASGA